MDIEGVGGERKKEGGKKERRQARHRREQQEGRRGATASTSNPPSQSPGPIRSPAEAAIKIGQNGKVRFNRVVPSPASLQTYRVHYSRIKAGFQRENAAAENQRPAPARHPYSAKAPTTTNPRKDQPSVPKRKCRKSVRLQLKQTAEKPSGRTGQVQQGCQRPPQPDILTAQKRSFASPTWESAARVHAKCPHLSPEGVGQPRATRPP